MAISTFDIYWLAGLLEGEGCFCISKRHANGKTYPKIVISLDMTDLEPVEKVSKLFNRKIWKNNRLAEKGYKPSYRVISENNKAAAWMMTLFPLMSPRRQNKIKECLDVWKTQPGKNWRELRKVGV